MREEIAKHSENIDANKKEEKKRKDAVAVAKKEESDCNKEYRQLQKKLNDKNAELADFKLEIDRLKDAPHDTFYERKELDAKLNAEDDRLRSTETHIKNLEHSLSTLRGKIQQLKSEQSHFTQEKGIKEAQLRQLHGSADSLDIYGQDVKKFVSAIRQNSNSFSKIPIGPIGKYVSLRKNLNDDDGLLIENELSGVLRSFIVDNFNDRAALTKLQRQGGVDIPILVAKFSSTPYNITAGKCCVASYQTVYDALDVSNATVLNVLVDVKKIERILLIPNDEDAQKELKKQSIANANCIYAITRNRFKYYPYPNYRSYASAITTRQITYLRNNVESMRENVKKECTAIGSTLKDIEKKFQAQDIGSQLTEATNSKKEITNNIRQLRQQKEKSQQEDELGKCNTEAVLQEDLDKTTEEIEKLRQALNIAAGNHARFKEELDSKEKHYEEIKIILADEVQRIQNLSDQLEKNDQDIRRNMDEKEHFKLKQSSYEKKLQARVNPEIQTKQERLTEAIDKAKALNELAPPLRAKSAKELLEEINRLDVRIKHQQDSITLSEDEAKKIFLSAEKLARNAKNTLKTLNRSQEDLLRLIQSRKDGFRDIKGSFARRIQTIFHVRLAGKKKKLNKLKQYGFITFFLARGFEGDLNISHQKLAIVLTIIPHRDGGTPLREKQRRDMKSLSGGEKSYSTIALLSALWEVCGSPFRILDEFDVFMDSVNRRLALEQILDYVEKKKEFQYIFLTPLDTDLMASKTDVSIVRIDRPI